MASSEIKKLLPIPIDVDKAFWEGVQENKLLIQKCLDCGKLQFFPGAVCVDCFSRNLGWEQSKGTGSVYSFTLVRVILRDPVFTKQVTESSVPPPIFALIELDEGVRIMSNIIGCKPEEVMLGARVIVEFEEVEGTGFKLPKFRLAK